MVLAFDPDGKRLLWIDYNPDGGNDYIKMAAVDGSGTITTILDLGVADDAIGIAFDPVDKKVYWSHPTLIMRSNIEGTQVETVVSNQNFVHHLYIQGSHLYWTEPWEGKIERSNLDGSEAETVLGELTRPVGIAVTQDEKEIYWTEPEMGAPYTGRVLKSSLQPSVSTEILVSGLAGPRGIDLIPSVQLTDGLVAYYPFNNNANDESGNGYDATTINAGFSTDRLGHPASAASFNGIDQHIQIETHDFDFTNEFAFSSWVLSVSGSGRIFSKAGWEITVGSTGQESRFFQHNTGLVGGNGTTITSSNHFKASSWHHVCAVREASTMKLYINGTLEASQSFPGTVDVSNGWFPTLGANSGALNLDLFGGDIDNVRFYNRPLSAVEVGELFQLEQESDQPGPTIDLTKGLLAFYGFNGNTDDESGNGRHGILEGATLGTNRFGMGGGCYSFDGIDDRIVVNGPWFSGNADRTISIWFKTTQDQGNLFTFGDGNQSNSRFSILLPSQGGAETIQFIAEDNDYEISTGDFRGQWAHVVITLESAWLRVYLDGGLVAECSKSLATDGTLPLVIGANSLTRNDEFFPGLLDDLRVYDRALSPAEVAQLHYLEQSEDQSETPITISEGLVAFYRFDNSGTNAVADQLHLESVDTGYSAGINRQAADFAGTFSHMVTTENIPIVGNTPRTVSAWIYLRSFFEGRRLLTWGTGDETGSRSGIVVPSNGALMFTAHGRDAWTGSAVIQLETWQHIAVVYNGSLQTTAFYVNGTAVPIAQIITDSDILNTVPTPLHLGYDNLFPYVDWNRAWDGKVDNLRIYSRALSQAEVEQLYANDGNSGTVPAITVPPVNQTVNVGEDATFTVTATGIPAPTYQWFKNDAAIDGATSPAYTLSNVSTNDTGSYFVEVSNRLGSVRSTAVTLTVLESPSPVFYHDDFGTSNSVWKFTLIQTGGNQTAMDSSYGKIEDGLLKLKANVGCGWDYLGSFATLNMPLPPEYVITFRARKLQWCGALHIEVMETNTVVEAPWVPPFYGFSVAGTWFSHLGFKLSEESPQTDIPPTSGSFNYGDWYSFRIEKRQDSLRVFVNGSLQYAHSGAIFSGGYLHLFTASAGATAEIDDLDIANISPFRVSMETAAVRLRWFADRDVTYRVQWSSDFQHWSNLTSIVGTGNETNLLEWTDGNRRFYRVIKE